MGRPRLHDEKTRGQLLAAAERLTAEGGIDAVSVRATADAASTSTRAVYALFGSKDGLVQALAQRAFELVMESVGAIPFTDDPGDDLVSGSVSGFRVFALKHPDLFRLFFTAERTRERLSVESLATRLAALALLTQRVERAEAAGLLGDHSVDEVTILWDALCCGLAMREICGHIRAEDGERIWTHAVRALLTGLGASSIGSGTRAAGPHGVPIDS
ncbi:MAG: TetR/AcrR family transcriptional regulator [Candidatus Dormibacteria bacterium]